MMFRSRKYFGDPGRMSPDQVAEATYEDRYYSQAIDDDYGDSADNEYEFLREERTFDE